MTIPSSHPIAQRFLALLSRPDGWSLDKSFYSGGERLRHSSGFRVDLCSYWSGHSELDPEPPHFDIYPDDNSPTITIQLEDPYVAPRGFWAMFLPSPRPVRAACKAHAQMFNRRLAECREEHLGKLFV